MGVFSTVDDKEEHLGTAYWAKYIKHRIKKNKNFMGVFIGQTGSGKSYSMMGLADKLQEGGINMNNLFLKASSFLERLVTNQLSKGDVLCWDETGVDLNSKQWQSKTNRMVNTIMQVFRKENLIVLFTLPYFSFLDSDARKLVHAVFETMGIDYNTKEVIIKPKLVQVNQDTGKMYKKYLRVKVPGKGLIPIKKIRLGLVDAEKLKLYEQKKDEFSRKLYQDAFNSVSELEFDKNKLSDDENEYITYYNNNPDATLKEFATNFNLYYQNGAIKGHPDVSKAFRIRKSLEKRGFLRK